MSKMQDLEDRIMSCWHIVDDIKEVLKSEHIEDDKTMNILIGLSELYEIKFANMWTVYEEALKEYYTNQRNLRRVTNQDDLHQL